ncbi:type IV secretion system protein TraC [Pasteurella multocida]|uniref:type IV secretion system protein TraC n=1 Tax=Pasteurella multocida TaxID=747 RepID=UPI00148164A5|nr:type IV secretion system protein TraC [Pasteurella multocida]NNH97765.1 type IV secretion system protein TraC [Pasteurella multocida]NNI42892.1 type IV secretion system protein TraC [Pasteurella multocida]
MSLNPLNIIKIIGELLGEKDTTLETSNILKELDYPHISDLIPLKYYDEDSELLINSRSVGFIIEAQPLIGANEQLVEGLDRLLQNNIPRDYPLQILLLGSQAVEEILDYGLKDFSWKGYKADECNNLTRNFYLQGAENVLKNRANHPLTLREYRLFFIYAAPTNSINETVFLKLKDAKRSLLSALNTNGIYSEPLGIKGVMSLIREIVNFKYGRLKRYSDDYLSEKDISKQVVNPTTTYQVKPSHIVIDTTDETGKSFKTRSVGFHLDRNPSEHYLWQNGNIISDLLNPERGIICPFIFTMIISTEEPTKSQAEANARYFDLEKKAKSSFAKIIPSTEREFKEWEKLRKNLLTGSTSISNYFVGIRFFCEDTEDAMMQESERVIKTFENQGMAMVRSDFMQIRDVLATIPFSVSDNPQLWGDFKRSGGVLRAETFQATNLLPIIADNKLSRSGIVLPSYRNQIAFLDVFDENLPNTNFNWFESGTSGAGKSVLSQSLGRQVLDRGGILSIFDIGDSYKAFCHSVGGTYINGSTLRFNPFANITDISKSAERIRDQLCILASPNGLLDEVHESLILSAITEQFPTYQQGMRIDHVVDYLKKYKREVHGEERIRGRIDEIIHLLTKYTTKGIYGEYFNSSEPTLKPNEQFVVTELGDLRASGDLLMAVLFTLMIWAENVMYNTPRDMRKMNIIDEGWKLLGGSSQKIRGFIEEGYRTARRHNGSFGTVTQAINDKNLSTAALAAYDNSSFKFTMMQDAKSFETFKRMEPNIFNDFECEIIRKFPAARTVGYSSVLVNVGQYSSFHRLLLDPLTNALFSSRGQDFAYREKRLGEGADIKEILFEMAEQNDPKFMDYLKSKQY